MLDNYYEYKIKMRYQQARSNSASRAANTARPISGAFTLDLDKIEGRGGVERLSEIGPKLVEHDLDDIINSDPVMLPVTRTGLQQVELLGPCIDHLFSMCCMQYRYVLQVVIYLLLLVFETRIFVCRLR